MWRSGIHNDRDLRVANRQFAALKRAHSSAPVYSYLFDYPTGVLDGEIGAAHSVELAFVFDNTDRVPLACCLAGTMLRAQCARRGRRLRIPGTRILHSWHGLR